jgi:hypothetical protein
MVASVTTKVSYISVLSRRKTQKTATFRFVRNPYGVMKLILYIQLLRYEELNNSSRLCDLWEVSDIWNIQVSALSSKRPIFKRVVTFVWNWNSPPVSWLRYVAVATWSIWANAIYVYFKHLENSKYMLDNWHVLLLWHLKIQDACFQFKLDKCLTH